MPALDPPDWGLPAFRNNMSNRKVRGTQALADTCRDIRLKARHKETAEGAVYSTEVHALEGFPRQLPDLHNCQIKS
jgi:hypothetical protein